MTDPAQTAIDAREREWCDRIRSGDEGAFAALFRRYYEPLTRFVFREVRNQDLAEDVVQAVFASIWDLRERWVVTGSVRGYLYGAVRYQLLSRHREQRVRVRHEAELARLAEASAANTTWGRTEGELELSEFRAALARAVAALPPRGREAFELSRRDGLTYAEIAEVMAISPKTVEVHITRALAALRTALSTFLSVVALFQSR